MRVVLYSLCVAIVLLASALFIQGYEGTQIREFLLGVAAIIVVASRMSKPQRKDDKRQEKSKATEAERGHRLSTKRRAQADGLEVQNDSESKQSGASR